MKSFIHRPALPNKRLGNSILRPTRTDIETPKSIEFESAAGILILGYARAGTQFSVVLAYQSAAAGGNPLHSSGNAFPRLSIYFF